MNTFEKAGSFIYRNARPLDFARWQYHFENGSRDAVLKALAAYQNEDGGFGHALEADSFNPDSSPIQTWVATEILREVKMTDRTSHIIKNILRYLDSGADFDPSRKQWLNTVPSNNEHPGAVWWKYEDGKGSSFEYNPTACLAGFAIRYAETDSKLYRLSCEIAKEAAEWFCAKAPFPEMHVTGCFLRLYEYCAEAEVQLFDMGQLLRRLKEQVNCNICRDTEKWKTDYCTFPSQFISSKDSPFYADNVEAAAAECRHIKENQLPDGSFIVPWQWCTEDKEYEVAVNWWKSDIIIKKLLYLKALEGM
ncbi:MAG: hypothetical protein K2P59_14805 [Acetatifactor sp.]|nr:hypothetical protein [Acetatifactor sp.]